MNSSHPKPVLRFAFAAVISISSGVSLLAQDATSETSPLKVPEKIEPAESGDASKPKREAGTVDDPLAGTPEDQSPEKSSISEEWTVGRLSDLLNGKADPPKGWPKDRFELRSRREVTVRHSDGKTGTRPVVESQLIDPKEKQLSSVHRHAICVMQFDAVIRDLRKDLDQANGAAAETEILDELAKAYSARFKIDTVYQDIKVKEIEQRAQKLRDELTARDEAEKAWVKAMMTLAELRADGIETMQTTTSAGVGALPSMAYSLNRSGNPVDQYGRQLDRSGNIIRSNPNVAPVEPNTNSRRQFLGTSILGTSRPKAAQPGFSALHTDRRSATTISPSWRPLNRSDQSLEPDSALRPTPPTPPTPAPPAPPRSSDPRR
ncbi:hypothetical protein [Planctomycetes bacterium K23_9]|uniref:Uncharacterized protein n=1 Tax=Stieleria marina TaxID=1930275 RepID=A0A517P3E7_9BACT|nr:hypothetical protein K239x_59160 [Planctomycetes bacterium K23_9]